MAAKENKKIKNIHDEWLRIFLVANILSVGIPLLLYFTAPDGPAAIGTALIILAFLQFISLPIACISALYVIWLLVLKKVTGKNKKMSFAILALSSLMLIYTII